MSASTTSMAPAVAAILDTTAIPPRKSCRTRQRTRASLPTQVKIDDLFGQWKEESMTAFSAADPRLVDNALLNDLTLDFGQRLALHAASMATPALSVPSLTDSIPSAASSDSIPSLCQDNWSEPSWGSPDSVNSFTSSPVMAPAEKKKRRPRSLVLTTAEALDSHPLDTSCVILDQDVVPDDIALSSPASSTHSESRSGFRPVITQSLQTLKSRALSSLQSFSLQNRFILPKRHEKCADSDSLWSHPFLFPRLSSEIRPQPFAVPPTESERHYFNPTAPTLDQQRASYRQALHPPVTFDTSRDATPLIQLQPFNLAGGRAAIKKRRTRRASTTSSDTVPSPPQAPLLRRREPRENSDFLRVVVLEMNMRRQGKLDDDAVGRARIWLPPRTREVKSSRKDESLQRRRDSTPARWTAIAAAEIAC